MQLPMPCVKSDKSNEPDYISSTVTLMAIKHAIRKMTGGFGEQKRKGRRDTWENVKTCHVVREVVVSALTEKTTSIQMTAIMAEPETSFWMQAVLWEGSLGNRVREGRKQGS